MKNKKILWIIMLFIILLVTPARAEGLKNSKVDLNKTTDKVSSLNKTAEGFKLQGDYKNALKNYIDALNLIHDTEQALENNRLLDEYEINSRLGLGVCYFYLEDFGSGAKVMQEINTQTAYWDLEASSYIKSQYYLVYGNVLTKLKEYDKADYLYSKLNETYGVYGGNIPGKAFFEAKEYGKAVEALQKNLIDTPFNVYVYLYLAKSYSMLQQYEEALKIYDFLIKDHPVLLEKMNIFDELTADSFDAYCGYGRQLRESGNTEKALEVLNSAIERFNTFEMRAKAKYFIDNQKANLYFELGYTYYMKKEYQKALKTFSILEEEINPEKSYPENILDFYDVTKKISSKEAANYYFYYAVSYEILGDKDKAHLYYTEANKYFKRYPDELTKMGMEAFMKNDFSKAIELLKTSINEKPQNMEANYYIAKAYLATMDKQQAEKTADLIILRNLTDLNTIYAFKSVIEQSDLNYKAADLMEDKMKKDFRRKVMLVSFVIILILCISITAYAIKGRKVIYANTLEELYADIEKLEKNKALSNESKAETTGLEF